MRASHIVLQKAHNNPAVLEPYFLTILATRQMYHHSTARGHSFGAQYVRRPVDDAPGELLDVQARDPFLNCQAHRHFLGDAHLPAKNGRSSQGLLARRCARALALSAVGADAPGRYP